VNLIFFVKSETVDISKYSIKDIPGSSGRLDVISRCVLSALTLRNKLEKNIQIWVFLDKYGTYIFNSNSFNNERFPKNEILLTDFFVDFIKKKKKHEGYLETPLDSIKCSDLGIFDAIKNYAKKNYKVYVLNENGMDFKNGDLLNDKELKELNLTNLSLGNRSYLASSTIRLIKMNLHLLV